jgi:hypothetical protein
MSSPAIERRADVRHPVSVVASLVRPDGHQRVSLVRDLSASGARMMVASNKLSVGDSVRVSLLFELEGGDCQTTGHLLRVASSDDGIWKQEVAVRFDERLTVDVASVVSGKS